MLRLLTVHHPYPSFVRSPRPASCHRRRAKPNEGGDDGSHFFYYKNGSEVAHNLAIEEHGANKAWVIIERGINLNL